jgi:rSAM/selenodomain-associated transferase 1
MLTKAQLCQVRLMCTPDMQHECFVSCAQKYPVQLVDQSGLNLGERMFIGISTALQTYKYCVVIGIDAPALDEVLIEQAIKVLHADTEVVFVPAEDGGYVLLGMRHAHEVLFKDIDWGSAEVMQQSRHKLKMNSISFRELATCWDVDRLEDYQRYLAM